MRVTVENSATTKQIQLGDIFVSRGDQTPYILLEADFGGTAFYELKALSGDSRWNFYNTLEEACDRLTSNVEHGKMTWFSKDEYDFELKITPS